MRKYRENTQLDAIWCNACGKKLIVSEGILREGAAMFDHNWDYFSEKDGEVHHFDLCEACYDEMTAQFCLPVEVEEQTEMI